jgi:hypothetical protein
MKPFNLALCLILATLTLVGCGDSQKPKKYLQFMGGGLTFNYRYSKATMVVVVRRVSPLDEGGKFVALFEIPGQSARQRVEVPNNPETLTFRLESNALTGIKKDVPLHVTVLAVDEKGVELDEYKTQFVSDVDQDTLPTKPLMDPNAPGYVPLPENMN